MATVNDKVRVQIEVDEDIRGLTQAQRRISNLDRLGGAVGRGITGAIGGAFAVAAGVGGVGLLSRGIMGLQSEIQEAEIGMASLISALTGQDIGASLKSAREQVAGLKEDAAAGAGELGHYTQGFQRILGPARTAGATLKEVRELNRQALAAGFAMRGAEGLLLAPMDVAQALTQGVGERTTPIVNQLLGAIKMTNEEFNRLSKPERMTALSEAFQTMAAGAELMGRTFGAQTATLKDNVKDIIRELTRPLFDLWTTQLESANKWMTDNRDKMREMAEIWGPRLAAAWGSISRNPGAAAGGLGAAAVTPGLMRFAAGGGVTALGAAAGASGAAAPGVGAAALAAILATVGGGFLAVKGALVEYPELLDSVAASTGLLLHSFTVLMDSLGTLTQRGSLLNRIGRLMVGGFSTAVDLFARGVLTVAAGIRYLGEGFRQLGLIFDAIQTPGGIAKLMRSGTDFTPTQTLVDDLRRIWTEPIRVTKVRRNSEGEGEGEGGVETPQTNVNIGKVEVQVQTEVNEDPNRVAAAFSEVLTRVNEFRLQASAAPLSPKPI